MRPFRSEAENGSTLGVKNPVFLIRTYFYDQKYQKSLLFLYDFHNLAADGLILTTVEETSFCSVEFHLPWKERDDFESIFLDDFVDLTEIRIRTMDIPEWEGHNDTTAEIRISESSEEICIH